MRQWIIHKLHGYTDIDDMLNRLTPEHRTKVLDRAVKKLFCTIGADDILQIQDGEWMFMGKALSEHDKTQLMAEANHLQKTKLWKVLQADIKYKANRTMFIKSKDQIDMIAGKLWLYTLDAINTRLKNTAKADAQQGL